MANQNNRGRTFWDFNLQSIQNGFYNINLNYNYSSTSIWICIEIKLLTLEPEKKIKQRNIQTLILL
jgi:hypothetical protein